MGVSTNGGIPKSSILIGCSLIKHPFRGTPIYGNPHIPTSRDYSCENQGILSIPSRQADSWRSSIAHERKPHQSRMPKNDLFMCVCV